MYLDQQGGLDGGLREGNSDLDHRVRLMSEENELLRRENDLLVSQQVAEHFLENIVVMNTSKSRYHPVGLIYMLHLTSFNGDIIAGCP